MTKGTDTVKTTTKKDSVAKVKIVVPAFKDIWSNYPDPAPIHLSPSTKKDIYENHCAIKVSEALLNAGIGMHSFKGNKCQHCTRVDGNHHALAAQEMANWLKLKPFPGCPTAIASTGQAFEKAFNNKQGIIFFKDYWQRNGESGETRTGDHIDLWDDKVLASIGSFQSFARINLGISIDGWFSDYHKATDVLLWEIK